MSSTETNSASYRKVAQLHAAIKTDIDIKYLEKILQKDGDINHQTANCNGDKTISAGCSLLHSAYRHSRFEAFKLLLSYDADLTATCWHDTKNRTVIHRIVQNRKNCLYSSEEFKDKYVDAVLAAHVNFGINSNPRCKDNVSHFHVACMANNVEAVEFFLKQGIDVNEAVNADSTLFAGYTPLHFAVEFSCLRVVEILLEYGADVRLKNTVRMSPVDAMIELKINKRIWDAKNESILEQFAKHVVDVNGDVNDFGLRNLHVACTIEDTSIVKSILEKMTNATVIDRQLEMNSPICPGYTPLHFAALLNVDAVKLLVDKGADVEVTDASGVTPFDLCLQKWGVEDTHYVITRQTRWKDIKISDNKTKLLDVVFAMRSVDDFVKFIANLESIVDLKVPEDSPLWPGYTILHLAVVFSEKSKDNPKHFGSTADVKTVDECLTLGCKVTKPDAKGSTSLHLAFYLQKIATVELLLKHHLSNENPVDSNDLSHFHIACAARDETSVARFLLNNADVNAAISSTIPWNVSIPSPKSNDSKRLFLAPGSTALHINAACGNVNVTLMLLEYGADVYATDVNGFTPIHRLLTSPAVSLDDRKEELTMSSDVPSVDQGVVDLLLGVDGLQDRITEGGLTHLHVAAYFDACDAAGRLVDSGADINAVVTYEDASRKEIVYGDPSKQPLSFLSRYSGCTPLHICSLGVDGLAQLLLTNRGADLLLKSPRATLPLLKVFDTASDDEQRLKRLVSDAALFERLTREFGLTRLHVACHLGRTVDWIEDLVKRGEDVNARVGEDAPIGVGNTPLHFAVANPYVFLCEARRPGLFKVLLDNGANVALKNADGLTALQVLSRQESGLHSRSKGAELILEHLREFDVDEAHSQSTSFFHFACLLKNVKVVEKFIDNGIDVNRPVDFFAEHYAGCSPLHLAAGYRSDDSDSNLQTVELLMKRGADVRAKDACENTVLHKVAASGPSSLTFFHTFANDGSDENAEKIRDDTAREKLILFDMFVRGGVDVNAENIYGETALEKLIKSENASWEEVECLMKLGSRVNAYDFSTQVGLVTKISNEEVLRKLMDSEYVDGVDKHGRTVLHNLVSTRDSRLKKCVAELIARLVKRGWDINRQDEEGRTALHTATHFKNNNGVVGLLGNGAEVNVTDNREKTAFAYSFEGYSKRSERDRRLAELFHDGEGDAIDTFVVHLHKMEACGLYISEVNKRLRIEALELTVLDQNSVCRFNDDVSKSKDIFIGSTCLTLYDFGIRFDVEMVYPMMPISERLEIDAFFENIHQHKLHELDYLLKIKYKNAVERLRLIDLAVVPFVELIKNQLPDLCCRVIMSFLCSSDLKNVIALEDM